MPLTDDSIMPMGMHKDKPMLKVPDYWLKWFWKENKRIYLGGQMPPGNSRDVMDYIKDSFNENELS